MACNKIKKKLLYNINKFGNKYIGFLIYSTYWGKGDLRIKFWVLLNFSKWEIRKKVEEVLLDNSCNNDTVAKWSFVIFNVNCGVFKYCNYISPEWLSF